MDEARGDGFYDLKSIVLICMVIFIISVFLFFATLSFYKEYTITENHISNYQEPIFKVMALNGTDYSNSTIEINVSHIAEIKESNGSLIIEIRKYHEGMMQHGVEITSLVYHWNCSGTIKYGKYNDKEYFENKKCELIKINTYSEEMEKIK